MTIQVKPLFNYDERVVLLHNGEIVYGPARVLVSARGHDNKFRYLIMSEQLDDRDRRYGVEETDLMSYEAYTRKLVRDALVEDLNTAD